MTRDDLALAVMRELIRKAFTAEDCEGVNAPQSDACLAKRSYEIADAMKREGGLVTKRSAIRKGKA